MSDARSIIATLRDGGGIGPEEARWFARGLADGTVDDAQAGAFAMAAFLNGLGGAGRVALTQAMRDSGDVLVWDLPGPVIDKHSTGGVGDTVSLILAPALAACGAYVPMISGRGLGHTGGTLDKMEAIPGYRALIDKPDLDRVLAQAGCAIVGATDRIAPADRRLYGIRDITSTVESIDLITASILSKKLAAGLEALVLDVKCGSGAFMPDLAAARALAQSLVRTANDAGCKTTALITDMDSPLAASAGNAIEVLEAISVLTGRGEESSQALRDLSCQLGGEILALTGGAHDAADGAGQMAAAIDSGRAAERFAKMVHCLGGPADLLDKPQVHLALAPCTVPALPTDRDQGYVSAIDTRAVGELVVHMGGGRLRSGDVIDPAVGIAKLARIGDRIDQGRALGVVHAHDIATAKAFAEKLAACYSLSTTPVDPAPLVRDRITG